MAYEPPPKSQSVKQIISFVLFYHKIIKKLAFQNCFNKMESSINETVLKSEINKICRTCLKVSEKVLQPIHANNQNTVFMLTNLNILQVRILFFKQAIL